MRVLAVNAGSSSLKLSVVEDGTRIARGGVSDWDGTGVPGLDEILDGVGKVDAVAHRVVHGGAGLTAPALISPEVLRGIRDATVYAPQHNPSALRGIEQTSRRLPDTPAVACFDTAFHAGLPRAASTYAVPAAWNERWHLRRFGAHGLSHAYAVRRAADLVGVAPEDVRLVTCHIGSGASLAAVRDGRSVDTTMGLTPLEGLVMATRAGSVDPGLLLLLLRQGSLTVDELANALERESGLKGLSGCSDLRNVLARRADGNAEATLAYDVYVHSLVRHIGAMTASAGGIDVLVFTGGVGEHQPALRADACAGLAHLGVEVDQGRNETAVEGETGATGSRVRVLVVPSGEDLEMAREVESTLR